MTGRVPKMASPRRWVPPTWLAAVADGRQLTCRMEAVALSKPFEPQAGVPRHELCYGDADMAYPRRRFSGMFAAALAGTILVAGCVSHQPKAIGIRAIRIDDRGISIPVPPPSLHLQPRQSARIEGRVEFKQLAAGSEPLGGTIELLELTHGARATVPMGTVEVTAPGSAMSSFTVESLVIDHTDNCLEVWMVAEDGSTTEPVYYHTEILPDDQSVTTVEGCVD